MSTVLVPDLKVILNDTGHRSKCHTIDPHGWSYCGTYRASIQMPDGKYGTHYKRDCASRGCRQCVECNELSRQLGDDGLIAA